MCYKREFNKWTQLLLRQNAEGNILPGFSPWFVLMKLLNGLYYYKNTENTLKQDPKTPLTHSKADFTKLTNSIKPLYCSET